MTLDEINNEWAVDSKIDMERLEYVSVETSQLHGKYLRYRGDENMLLTKLKHDLQELEAAKAERLDGTMTQEELKRRGWEVERRKLLRDARDRALESDPDLIKLKLRVAMQKEKVDTLDSIVKMIMARSFTITNAIAWVKFKSGVG
jgi:predicted nuclease with TOPRIM domain